MSDSTKTRRACRAVATAALSFPEAVVQAVEHTLASISCVLVISILIFFLFTEFVESEGPAEIALGFVNTELEGGVSWKSFC